LRTRKNVLFDNIAPQPAI